MNSPVINDCPIPTSPHCPKFMNAASASILFSFQILVFLKAMHLSPVRGKPAGAKNMTSGVVRKWLKTKAAYVLGEKVFIALWLGKVIRDSGTYPNK